MKKLNLLFLPKAKVFVFPLLSSILVIVSNKKLISVKDHAVCLMAEASFITVMYKRFWRNCPRSVIIEGSVEVSDDSEMVSASWSLSSMFVKGGTIVNDEHNIPPATERMSFLTWYGFS